MRTNDQPGYVLKRQDYGDTSLLVDLFSAEFGRLRVIVKGARSGRGEKARALQPFQKLILGWTGKSDLKTLTQLESTTLLPLKKDALACAFYMNELLWNFLEVEDPHPELFAQYESTLESLSNDGVDESLLRRYEFFLLQEIGYGASFDVEGATGDPVDHGNYYRYDLEQGLLKTSDADADAYPGFSLTAIDQQDFSDPLTLKVAKRIARQIIHFRMDGRELNSRKWFAASRSENA